MKCTAPLPGIGPTPRPRGPMAKRVIDLDPYVYVGLGLVFACLVGLIVYLGFGGQHGNL